MGRDKLRIADVARLTGLNRSTVAALYRETATRVDLPAVEQLCRLFRCSVGDLFEVVEGVERAPSPRGATIATITASAEGARP